MLEKGIALEKNITGKATNINELILQISALNAIRSTAEPTEEEVRENLGKIDKAVADLNQHLREERIDSLLAKERADMWRDFVEHRTVKSVSVSLNRKTDRYLYRINDKARISYEAFTPLKSAETLFYSILEKSIFEAGRFLRCQDTYLCTEK